MPDNRHPATATDAYLYSYLALVQPLSYLTKVSRQTGVKQPLPVTNLVVLVLNIGRIIIDNYLCSHFLPVSVKLLPGISTYSNLKV